jgi:Spy/CpxP family protein refolding chaperone
MKIITRAGVALIAAGTMSALGAGAAGAAGGPSPQNFGGNSPNIVNDYGDHYVNANNPDVRWDWACHQFATPGHGDDHANQDHSAVIDRPGDSGLVAPGDKSAAC